MRVFQLLLATFLFFLSCSAERVKPTVLDFDEQSQSPPTNSAPSPVYTPSECDSLEWLYQSGVDVSSLKKRYCAFNCNFLEALVDCSTTDNFPIRMSMSSVHQEVVNTRDERRGDTNLRFARPNKNFSWFSIQSYNRTTVVERFFSISEVFVPVGALTIQTLLAVARPPNRPPMLSYGFSILSFVAFVYFCANWFDITVYTAFVFYIGMFDNTKASLYDRTFSFTIILTMVSVITSIITNSLTVTLLLTAAIGAVYLHGAYVALTSRVSADASYVVQMTFLGYFFSRASVSLILINKIDSPLLTLGNYFFRGILPYGGSASLLDNYFDLMVYNYEVFAYRTNVPNPDNLTIITVLITFAAFVLVRAIYGLQILRSVRSAPTLYDVAYGFYIYCIDFTCVLRVFYILEDRSKKNVNLTLLALISTMSLFFEFMYAQEFIMLRMVLFLADRLGVISFPGHRLLSLYEANCEFVNLANFRQIGARAYFDLSLLEKYRKQVGVITATTPTASSSGVGFALTNAHGTTQLYTVEHVVSDGELAIQLDPLLPPTPVTKEISLVGGDDTDPIVALPITSETTPCLSHLSVSEVTSIDHLILLRKDDKVAIITNFSANPKAGVFNATVNLQSGDSGSPILAVLKDGTFRYAGAVSRGNSDAGGGNLLTAVCFNTAIRSKKHSPGPSSPIVPPIVVKILAILSAHQAEVARIKQEIAKVSALPDPTPKPDGAIPPDKRPVRIKGLTNQQAKHLAITLAELRGLTHTFDEPTRAMLMSAAGEAKTVLYAGGDATSLSAWMTSGGLLTQSTSG